MKYSTEQIADIQASLDRLDVTPDNLAKVDRSVKRCALLVAVILFGLVAFPHGPLSLTIQTLWLLQTVFILRRRVIRAQSMESLLGLTDLLKAIDDVREAFDQYVEIARHEVSANGRVVISAQSGPDDWERIQTVTPEIWNRGSGISLQ